MNKLTVDNSTRPSHLPSNVSSHERMNATADGSNFPRFDNMDKQFTVTQTVQSNPNYPTKLANKRRYNNSAERHASKAASPMVPALETLTKLSRQVGDMHRTAQFDPQRTPNAFTMFPRTADNGIGELKAALQGFQGHKNSYSGKTA